MSDVHGFEEAFILELKLYSDLYGYRTADQAQWATGSLPWNCVEPYMRAWQQGRSASWKNLQRLAQRIQFANGLDGEAWLSHLMHLEALAGVQASAVRPTTQASSLQ
jgi:hypothetical protein